MRRLSEGVAFHDCQVDGFVTRNIKSGKPNSALKEKFAVAFLRAGSAVIQASVTIPLNTQ